MLAVAAALLFCLPKLGVYADYRFTFDDVYYMTRALDAREQPSVAFEPDYTSRSHPLFLAVLGSSQQLFGTSARPLAALLLATHIANAILLGALIGRLKVDRLGQWIAAGAPCNESSSLKSHWET